MIRTEATTRGDVTHDAPALNAHTFALALLLVILAALSLRLVYPVADPPHRPGVGIVWHDEGAWVHNARNRALFGAWTLDEWNPMYVSPVFTGLEYASFSALGVGLRQARLVPELLGVLSVLLLGLGVAATTNRLAGLLAAGLLATNFLYVMYDRAATLDATMVAILVVAWYGYARAANSPKWGLLAGFGAVLAYFTKASAAFFVAALALDALFSIAASRWSREATVEVRTRRIASARYALVGLGIAAGVALIFFVLPNWHAYTFYNWQVSVTRKPSYTLRAILDRALQLPLSADFFTRLWAVVVIALLSLATGVTRWRRLLPAERLLQLWVVLGAVELVAHDIQDRRLVILIPPLVAIAAIALGRGHLPAQGEGTAGGSGHDWRLWVASLPLFFMLYFIVAPIARLPFMLRLDPGAHPGPIVRTAVVLASMATLPVLLKRDSARAWLARQKWGAMLSVLVVAMLVAGDLVQFGDWASRRTYKNYEAMLLIRKWLPPGTLVHGKLANGLSLESRIRPVFVGRGFGNYADRTTRDDVRYLVTYISPFIGYEGGRDSASGRSIIWDVLDAYPHRRILHVFDLAESPEGADAGMLIDKGPRPTAERTSDGNAERQVR